MDLFSLREAEIFEALKQLKGINFVVIGGYAVSAYTLPRFSVDCDLVLRDRKTAENVSETLQKRGFLVAGESEVKGAYEGSFTRLEKTLERGYKASFDLLIGAVYDRRTRSSFSAQWVSAHSKKRRLRGKTFSGSVEARVIGESALIAMKLTSSRKTDLRDVFMLLPQVEDLSFIKKSVNERTDLKDALKRAGSTILSDGFKKNLEGVYGYLDERTYQKHVKVVKDFVKSS